MYRFARCIPNPKCPDTQGWYLVLKPHDLATFMELHIGVANFYFCKFGSGGPPLKGPDLGVPRNPIRLAELWLETIEKFRAAGTTLVVNRNGGALPLDSVEVVTEIESEKMYWPRERGSFEVITISRWLQSQHYYLSSNMGRVFVPPKYAHYEDARLVAEMYTDKIEDRGC